MSATSSLTSPFVLRIPSERLIDFCTNAMTTVGLSETDACLTAEILVRTDKRGIYTHGTVSLRRYVQLMRDGGIDTNAVPEITGEGPAWAQIDAHQSIGMVAGHAGMKIAIQKARECGIGMAGVRHSNHFGAASAYALMALGHTMLGICMSNTDVVMNIPGGRGAVLGNNPLSYAVPTRAQPPIVLDIAMSTVAGGKVIFAKERGNPLPEGWLTNKEGLPTTDPGVFTVSGALTPFGNHKGYGLALLVESLAGVLAGAAMTLDILSWSKTSAEPCNEGHSFIAIDIGAMMPIDQFYQRIDELVRRMREAPKAKGATRIYVPGEMEHDSENKAREEGVPLTQMAVDSLTGLAEDTGLKDNLPF